jgi:hypothetical protein
VSGSFAIASHRILSCRVAPCRGWVSGPSARLSCRVSVGWRRENPAGKTKVRTGKSARRNGHFDGVTDSKSHYSANVGLCFRHRHRHPSHRPHHPSIPFLAFDSTFIRQPSSSPCCTDPPASSTCASPHILLNRWIIRKSKRDRSRFEAADVVTAHCPFTSPHRTRTITSPHRVLILITSLFPIFVRSRDRPGLSPQPNSPHSPQPAHTVSST